jgi:putative transposase
MIRRLQQGMKEDGLSVPITMLCRWFEVPRRTVYYRPVKSAPKVQERFAAPIKQLIEADPSFGYRSVAGLLQFNKNTVQRIFQIKGWHVRKRAVGHRPRIEALPSVARTPNERWATNLCRVWAGRDGWQTVALVIDCHTHELLGWQPSRSARATTAMSALEQALIARFGKLGRITTPSLLRSDNGLVFTARAYTRLVRSWGLRQEFITPHCPRQNGTIERVIRTM